MNVMKYKAQAAIIKFEPREVWHVKAVALGFPPLVHGPQKQDANDEKVMPAPTRDTTIAIIVNSLKRLGFSTLNADPNMRNPPRAAMMEEIIAPAAETHNSGSL